ncbi:HD family phosphohydrolase [Paludisphaera mucosa]|uniref:HDIG domain-containing protein n=1 Tax=Paludisphaera mucosa TaxID=3030827 RepID=A0ABT6FGB3_9BACT|nr:HDIG domain-containing metalloprotein [Paludisphaera mucosa]MDG3006559.1 HDIG domain-containing protein [Paludisphaera mucosa]
MSIGKRRPKPNRAQLRSFPSVTLQQNRTARQRARIVSFSLIALTVLVTSAIVHGSGPPFVYRLGQRPEREIRVKVKEFRIRNQTKTSNERQAAADQVPLVMINDPAPIKDLAERLDDLTVTIAKSQHYEDVDPTVVSTWKLKREAYLDVKAATDTPQRRDNLHVQIAKAFAPLLDAGVLGPGALPRNEESSRTLAIRDVGQSADEARIFPRERVVPERIVKPDGPVAKEFVAAFTPSRVGETLFQLVADRLDGRPTLSFDQEETARLREIARNAVGEKYDPFREGQVLVEQGQAIGEEQLILLRMEHDTAISELTYGEKFQRALGVLALVSSLFILAGFYVARHERRIASDLGRIAMLCALVVLCVGVVRLLANQAWNAELIPVAAAAMILAIAYNPNFGLMATFALSILTCMALGTGISHFLILLGGTAAGVLGLNDVRTRTKLIKVGATSAAVYLILTWAAGLWEHQPIELIRSDGLWRAGWGLMAGFFMGGSLPFLENAFGIVTGISLLELGDNTHPLLQELVRRAPGTHNHSITVGAIAEAAAERIGANGLLVRIGAYFHDIGKMLKPHYFIENQVGSTNRHANLAPAMSTLIIIGHVKDGVDLGRQHHLPERIIDLIEQHHGTTLVEYFYHEANRRNGGNPDAAVVQESAFRYPGPKPQTKEAGILMMSDCVESASRTLSEPTPSRIEGLVSELIDKRLRDGQFDESGLTLREIAEIRDSLIKSLIGIYHGRVKYPEQRTA